MAEAQVLTAERRERAGKGGARATRRAGRIPGILYGDRKDPELISVDPRALDREIRKPGFFATLFELKLDGQTIRVLPRDLQLDPVSDRPIHVDFMRVGAGARVTVAVPVVFQNEALAPGLKRGGVLNVVRHEIEVVCAPDLIPHQIVVDLTGLDIGDSVHISAVKLPEGVRPTITDRDFTIATVAAPTVVKAEAEEAAAAAGAEAAAPAAAAPAAAGGAPAAAPGAEKKPSGPEKK
ncbi:MAG: 50S ribosomal protein L25/general stress protein Ctc [Rhodospirillaceae bacterium]|nr:50S ribosomal protein L25/general stress protein Ctc [Rhodospirillaceae bacterium]